MRFPVLGRRPPGAALESEPSPQFAFNVFPELEAVESRLYPLKKTIFLASTFSDALSLSNGIAGLS